VGNETVMTATWLRTVQTEAVYFSYDLLNYHTCSQSVEIFPVCFLFVVQLEADNVHHHHHHRTNYEVSSFRGGEGSNAKILGFYAA
jgi:hypothetical protein